MALCRFGMGICISCILFIVILKFYQMGHDYNQSKKIANKTIGILAIITISEVLFALMGKGYIINGVHFPHVLISGVMILMSII